MLKKRILGWVCVLVLVMAALSGAVATEGMSVTDMKGRTVVLDSTKVTRIVALAPSDCEILYAIGAGDLLVGRGMDCNEPEEVLALPVVESGATTNVEQIIALQPQVVLMNTMGQTVEQVQALENAGIQVVATQATDIEGVYTSIGLIGLLTGKETEATALTQQMQTSFDQIREKAEAMEPQTVYFEVSPLQYGLWTAGKGTFLEELAGICGLTNLFGDVEGWAEVSQEQVIDRNPDVIITLTPSMEGAPSPMEEIIARPGWEKIAALENRQVFQADSDLLSRPGPRLVDAAQMLFDLTYGMTE